jgi:DNA-binding CsgD family transcriptional regulator
LVSKILNPLSKWLPQVITTIIKDMLVYLTCERELGTRQQNTNGERERLTSYMERLQELSSKGHSQREIASMLQIGLGSVNRDLSYLKNRAKVNIRKYIDGRLPEEYEKCLVGLNSIVKEAWTTSQQTQDIRKNVRPFGSTVGLTGGDTESNVLFCCGCNDE